MVSFAVSRIPLFDHMSDSLKISLLTVLIAGLAAVFFPVKEENGQTSASESDKEAVE